MVRTALMFGTFDGLHAGHHDLFRQARKHADYLTVILARDETVRHIKGRPTTRDEDTRREELLASELADAVILGSLGDKYSAIGLVRPDVILLGYDQYNEIAKGLEANLKSRGFDIPIIRLEPFQPDKYKSSILNNKK